MNLGERIAALFRKQASLDDVSAPYEKPILERRKDSASSDEQAHPSNATAPQISFVEQIKAERAPQQPGTVRDWRKYEAEREVNALATQYIQSENPSFTHQQIYTPLKLLTENMETFLQAQDITPELAKTLLQKAINEDIPLADFNKEIREPGIPEIAQPLLAIRRSLEYRDNVAQVMESFPRELKMTPNYNSLQHSSQYATAISAQTNAHVTDVINRIEPHLGKAASVNSARSSGVGSPRP